MRKFLLLFIVIYSVNLIQGQSIELLGGVNSSKVSGDVFNTSSIYGFHLGIQSEVPFNVSFSFVPGLYMNTKGYKINFFGTSSTRAYSLDIPLNFRYSHMISNDFKIYVIAGGYFGFLLNGKVDDNKLIIGKDSSSDMKRFDFGLSIGAGLIYKQLIFGLSYNFGLYSVLPDTEYKNRFLQVSIGYRFNL